MSKWIKISDKLPEMGQEYLVCEDEEIFLALLTRYGEWYEGGHRLFRVTHWMPLPELPEELRLLADWKEEQGEC